jgi:hypothetical protein
VSLRRLTGRALLLLVLLTVCVAAVGCTGQTESLVGLWVSSEQGETLDFRADGILIFTSASGESEALSWQADDSNVALKAEGGGTRTLGYSIDGGVLTLTYPEEEPARYERFVPQPAQPEATG